MASFEIVLQTNPSFNGTIIDPRQTNIRHYKPLTSKQRIGQTLDIVNKRYQR